MLSSIKWRHFYRRISSNLVEEESVSKESQEKKRILRKFSDESCSKLARMVVFCFRMKKYAIWHQMETLLSENIKYLERKSRSSQRKSREKEDFLKVLR